MSTTSQSEALDSILGALLEKILVGKSWSAQLRILPCEAFPNGHTFEKLPPLFSVKSPSQQAAKVLEQARFLFPGVPIDISLEEVEVECDCPACKARAESSTASSQSIGE